MQGVPEALMRPALTKTLISCLWYRGGRSSTYLLFEIYCNGTELAPQLLFCFYTIVAICDFLWRHSKFRLHGIFTDMAKAKPRTPPGQLIYLGAFRQVSARWSRLEPLGQVFVHDLDNWNLIWKIVYCYMEVYLASIVLFNCTLWDSAPDGSLQWSSMFKCDFHGGSNMVPWNLPFELSWWHGENLELFLFRMYLSFANAGGIKSQQGRSRFLAPVRQMKRLR